MLSFEEIQRLVGILASMGVDEVRLTGGEPLVRRDLPVLVGMLAATPGVDDLSLTTNGVLLDRLAEPLVAAGLQRLNVSLDSLSHVRFAEITRRDALDAVLKGLETAEQFEELRPIKVNCVAVKGFTEEEVPALAELARRKPYVVRFIEFMPLDADEAWRADKVLTGDEIRALIEARWPLVEIPAKASSTARRFRFADGKGEIGFINPVSEPFCSSCDRIRLTADGQLRTCLFSRRDWDLKTPLRDGATDADLEALLRNAVAHKELKHRINEPGLRPREPLACRKSAADPSLQSGRCANASPASSRAVRSTSCSSSRSGSDSCSRTRSRAASPTASRSRRRSRTAARSSTSSAGCTGWSSSTSRAGRCAATLLMHALNWTYWLSQFAVVGLALLWIYFRRNDAFRGVRDWLIAANLIGLVGYVLMPTAPPRMFPEWGFIDSLADSAALNHGTGFIQLAANPYAAMPSLHGADALIIGISMYGLVKSRWAKVLWLLWPAWVWFAVMATANHFWLDIAAGVAIAGVAYVVLAWWESRRKAPELAPAPNERC